MFDGDIWNLWHNKNRCDAFICWLFLFTTALHTVDSNARTQINNGKYTNQFGVEKRKEKQFNTSNKWNSMHKTWIRKREIRCIFSTFVVDWAVQSSFLLLFLIEFYFAYFHFVHDAKRFTLYRHGTPTYTDHNIMMIVLNDHWLQRVHVFVFTFHSIQSMYVEQQQP